MGRSTIVKGESAVLRESKANYNTLFDVEKRVLRPESTYFGHENNINSEY